MWEDGSGEETAAKKASLSEAKKRSSDFFQKKIGWHLSFAAPGDTNPTSDATALDPPLTWP